MAPKGHYCSSFGCSNRRGTRPDLSFYRFPLDKDRSRVWTIKCGRQDLDGKSPEYLHQNCRLCSQHFEPAAFLSSVQTRKRLKCTAVPSIFNHGAAKIEKPRPFPNRKSEGLTTQKGIAAQVDATTQTTTVDYQLKFLKTQCIAQRRKIKALKRQMRKLPHKNSQTTARNTKLKKLEELLAEFVSGNTLDFMMTQLREGKKRITGRRWTEDEKALAMSFFHTSPKAYAMLRRIFALPAPSTLKAAVQNLQIYPGFSARVLEAMNIQAKNMSCRSIVCALVFDEMCIKESLSYNSSFDEIEGFEDFGRLGKTKFVANHALVFMARGLSDRWKQPLGYFLTSGPASSQILHTLLLDCITALNKAGLLVKVIVCDQGSNNQKLFHKHLMVSIDKPYFFVNGTKIFAMYDPPHLLKSVRNNLYNKGFSVIGTEEKIDWSYIKRFYQLDSKQCIRMAPSLKASHIYLKPFAKMRVSLAAQTLSHSVAAGIMTMLRFGAFPQEAKSTAHFIMQFNDLFDCFNSQTLTSAAPLKSAVSSNSKTIDHIQFLKKINVWLNGIVPSSSSKLPCLEGWKLSIQALINLWADLTSEHGFKFLLTNRLNQDCLENLFSMIRAKGGNRENPTALEFRVAFAQTVVSALAISSKNTNCKSDVDVHLFSLHQLGTKPLKSNMRGECSSSLPPQKAESQGGTFFNGKSFPELHQVNVLAYLSGYIAKQLSMHVCLNCKKSIISKSPRTSKEYTLINTKQYKSIAHGLTTPSIALLKLVNRYEKKFRRVAVKALHVKGEGTGVKDYLRSVLQAVQVFQIPNGCLNHTGCKLIEKIIALFINIRLHFCLKMNKNRFRTVGLKRNKKILKLQHK